MMKILLLSGSPRANGNTKTALNHILKGLQANRPDVEVELIDAARLKLSGCTNCEACRSNGGTCIIHDDGPMLTDKIYEADVVVFATPVYYWGMTAQMKMVVDKLYAKSEQPRRYKKIGLVSIGEAQVDDIQYELIHSQFKCICDYLTWDLVFNQAACALDEGDLAKNPLELEKAESFWQFL